MAAYFEKCESKAEQLFLNHLGKIYADHDIQQQKSIGKYRLDFFTPWDGIGWEVDGKAFHDSDRDRIRDQIILSSGQVAKIVRVPAALVSLFSCGLKWSMVRISRARPEMRQLPYAFTEQQVQDEIACYMDHIRDGEMHPDECINLLANADAVREANGSCQIGSFEIGCALRLIPCNHVIWKYVPKHKKNLYSWCERVCVHALDN